MPLKNVYLDYSNDMSILCRFGVDNMTRLDILMPPTSVNAYAVTMYIFNNCKSVYIKLCFSKGPDP